MIAELTSWLMSTGCKWDMWRAHDGTVCVMLFAGDDILNGTGTKVGDPDSSAPIEKALTELRGKYTRLRRAA